MQAANPIGNVLDFMFGGFGRKREKRDRNEDPKQRADELRAQAEAAYPNDEATKRLVGLVERRFAEARDAKSPYLRKWTEAIAFYHGDHYGVWNDYTKSLEFQSDVPEWRVRMIDNQITVMVLTLAAKRAQAKHKCHGLPNNPYDPEDVAAADITTKLVKHLERVSKAEGKRLDAIIRSTIYGTAFMVPYWDPRRKATLATVGPDGLARPLGEAPLGEQDFEVCSVWDIFPQPADCWDDVEWCIKAKMRSLEWVRRTFPERGYLVQPSGEKKTGDTPSERDAAAPRRGRGESQRHGENVLVMDYYERPCADYPEGRWAVVAGGILLYEEESLPHPNGAFPVVPVVGIPAPGRLWGMGWVELVVEQQRQLNRVESQIIENANLMANPKGQAADEAEIDEDAFFGGPGEIIRWRSKSGGVPMPGFITAPPLPSYVQEMPEQIASRIGQVTGKHEVSDARAPSGVTAASALQLLAGQDATRLSLTVKLEAESWRELMQQMVESAQARYTVPRLLKIVGKGKEAETIAFMGTDLRGNTEVGIVASDGVSEDPAFQREKILGYINAGLIAVETPEDAVDLFEVLNEPELVEFAERKAERMQQMAAAEAAAAEEQALAAEEEAAMQQEAAQGQQVAQQEQAERQSQERMQMAREGNQTRMAVAAMQQAGRGQGN